MICIPAGITTSVNPQPLKADFPISSSCEGRESCVRLEQYSNALSATFFKEFGNVKRCKLRQFLKASGPISVTDPGL